MKTIQPRYTKAAILRSLNQPLIVDEVELPQKLDTGQVLVKLHVSGICGSQIGEIKGVKGEDPFLPHLMGHEGCATVLDVGPGVQFVSKDDLVVLHWREGKGIRARPPVYKWNNEIVNAGWVTTFNSYAVVSENRCTPIPKNTDREIAALFGCAITTGFGVIQNNANLRIGESVVIFGAGGIGLNILQASKLVSAWPIIAVDLHDNRLDLASKLNATHVINGSREDSFTKIKEILGGNKLDVFVDNTGLPNVIENGYKLLNKNGRLILVGVPVKGSEISINSLPLHFGKKIIGSHGGECIPYKDIPRLLNLMNQGIFSAKELITARYSLNNINNAIDAMINGSTSGRIIINL